VVNNAEELVPIVVTDETGAVTDAVITSRKGLNKSREQGNLWTLHRETGRLLPYRGGVPFQTIREHGGWADVRLDGSESAAGTGAAIDVEDSDSGEPTGASAVGAVGEPPVGTGSAIGSEKGDHADTAGAGGVAGDDTAGRAELPSGSRSQGLSASRVFTELTELIRQRHLAMPEGSYTTHLFSSGEEKIRKKTGEEAIELILARSDAEVEGEAADLLYHLLVLLEARGIPFDRIVEKLAERRSG